MIYSRVDVYQDTGNTTKSAYLSRVYLSMDSCIAVLGFTKTGGVYYPVEFHKSLELGACWGAAYKSWYDNDG